MVAFGVLAPAPGTNGWGQAGIWSLLCGHKGKWQGSAGTSMRLQWQNMTLEEGLDVSQLNGPLHMEEVILFSCEELWKGMRAGGHENFSRLDLDYPSTHWRRTTAWESGPRVVGFSNRYKKAKSSEYRTKGSVGFGVCLSGHKEKWQGPDWT